MKSENALPDYENHTMTLPAPAKDMSYAIYQFPGVSSGNAPFNLKVRLAEPLVEGYYVGIADYARKIWRWTYVVPAGDESIISIDPQWQAISPTDSVFAAIITWDGVTAVLAQLTLNITITPVYGLVFGPYLDVDPNMGGTVSEQRVRELLTPIAPYCEWVRTTGSRQGMEYVPAVAHSLGLKAAAACWLSDDLDANALEVDALIALVQEGNVDLAIVGTEVLHRLELDENQLIAYIQQVRDVCQPLGVDVTTSEVWGRLLEHPEVMDECDVVLVNIYPYWENIPIERAMKCVHYHYSCVENVANANVEAGGERKQVLVGETGWPSAGAPEDLAATPENAVTYFRNFTSWARAEGVGFFYFEAYDEAWKELYEGPQASHWGIWDGSGALKPFMEKVFANENVEDNWSSPPPVTIQFTYVPPIGSFDNVTGNVTGVNFADYKVAVYIHVNGGWWMKPSEEWPLTVIDCQGNWECDYTTGGQDELATSITAFLVPWDYVPDLCLGLTDLPESLSQFPSCSANR